MPNLKQPDRYAIKFKRLVRYARGDEADADAMFKMAMDVVDRFRADVELEGPDEDEMIVKLVVAGISFEDYITDILDGNLELPESILRGVDRLKEVINTRRLKD